MERKKLKDIIESMNYMFGLSIDMKSILKASFEEIEKEDSIKNIKEYKYKICDEDDYTIRSSIKDSRLFIVHYEDFMLSLSKRYNDDTCKYKVDHYEEDRIFIKMTKKYKENKIKKKLVKMYSIYIKDLYEFTSKNQNATLKDIVDYFDDTCYSSVIYSKNVFDNNKNLYGPVDIVLPRGKLSINKQISGGEYAIFNGYAYIGYSIGDNNVNYKITKKYLNSEEKDEVYYIFKDKTGGFNIVKIHQDDKFKTIKLLDSNKNTLEFIKYDLKRHSIVEFSDTNIKVTSFNNKVTVSYTYLNLDYIAHKGKLTFYCDINDLLARYNIYHNYILIKKYLGDEWNNKYGQLYII